MNILKEADKIVNERSEEKDRQYGPFSEGMARAAQIMSGGTGKDITASDMYIALVALKLSRQSYNHKTDNLLDSVAYLGALNNHIEEQNEVDEKGNIVNKKKSALQFGTEVHEAMERKLFIPSEYRGRGWKRLATMRDISVNGFTNAKRMGMKKTAMSTLIWSINKDYGLKIFCDRTKGVTGNYVICGSQRGDLDLAVSEWDAKIS